MKAVKNVVSALSEVLERLALSQEEKQQLKNDLLTVFLAWEKRVMEACSAMVKEEGKGRWWKWLWRPLLMLVLNAVRAKKNV